MIELTSRLGLKYAQIFALICDFKFFLGIQNLKLFRYILYSFHISKPHLIHFTLHIRFFNFRTTVRLFARSFCCARVAAICCCCCCRLGSLQAGSWQLERHKFSQPVSVWLPTSSVCVLDLVLFHVRCRRRRGVLRSVCYVCWLPI